MELDLPFNPSLGNKLKVSAYPEDLNVNTVLVEGSVDLYNVSMEYDSSSAVILKPCYKGELDKFRKKIDLEEVNTEIYTG